MRSVLLLLLIIAACARTDEQTMDTAGAASGAPAQLTASDVSGSWNGTTRLAETDSVISRWTTSVLDDSTAVLVFEGRTDSIRTRVTFDADSMVSVSEPYTATTLPGQPQVRFRTVGRLQQDGRLAGTSALTLVSAPDSVIRRTRWEATRGSP